MKNKVWFIHGRPGPHPLHKKYGESVSDTHVFVDPVFRWHDKNLPGFINYIYWVLNGLWFAFKFRKGDVILTEGVHVTILLSKKLSAFVRKKIYVTALMDDEFLYFLTTGYYKGVSLKFNQYFIQQYDHFFCISEMLYKLCTEVIKDVSKISKSFNGVNDERLKILLNNTPHYTKNNIIFIGNGPSGWRAYYKGLDLTLQAFNKIAKTINDARLVIIGQWDKSFFMSYVETYCSKYKSRIDFIGQTKDLGTYLGNASVYIHPGRGEAWGISINEAMAAGIVPFVSNWTGASESVIKIDPNFVVPLNADEISSKVINYLQQPLCYKEKMGSKAKLIASSYSESAAIENFKKLFNSWNEKK